MNIVYIVRDKRDGNLMGASDSRKILEQSLELSCSKLAEPRKTEEKNNYEIVSVFFLNKVDHL